MSWKLIVIIQIINMQKKRHTLSMKIRQIGHPNFRSDIRFKIFEYLDTRSGKFESYIRSDFFYINLDPHPDHGILKTGYPDPIRFLIYNNKIINITLYLVNFYD